MKKKLGLSLIALMTLNAHSMEQQHNSKKRKATSLSSCNKAQKISRDVKKTKKLFFISGSQNKFDEMRSIIPTIKRTDIDLDEIQEIDAKKVIEAKLQEAFKRLRSKDKKSFKNETPSKNDSLFVEDTSLYLDALNGQLPGPLIKWFMKSIDYEGIHKLAHDANVFGARAITYIGYAANPTTITYYQGTIKGTIVAPRGDNGFGWDAIFQPEGSDKTFAQMTLQEKSTFSMRTLAAQELKKAIDNKIDQ